MYNIAVIGNEWENIEIGRECVDVLVPSTFAILIAIFCSVRFSLLLLLLQGDSNTGAYMILSCCYTFGKSFGNERGKVIHSISMHTSDFTRYDTFSKKENKELIL